MKKVIARILTQLALELRENHAQTHSWRLTAADCKVLTEDGRPNPALAYRIAMKGYDPKRIETRMRLGLTAICPVCKRPIE